jgi:hypothetical protein
MSERPAKTMEQITQDVLNSPFGIDDETLSALFADESTTKTLHPTTKAPTTPSEETATEPDAVSTRVEESTPVQETVPPIPAPEPARGGSDSSLAKVKELEETLKAQQMDAEQIKAMLQELARRAQVNAVPAQAPSDPFAEIDDQAIIESPKESILKLMGTMLKIALPAAFMEYDQAVINRRAMEEFRNSKPDFDELRPIMRQIVLENPSANNDPTALPRIYEEAKRRKAVQVEAIKRELNLTPATPSMPAPVPAVSEEELLAKLEQRIAEKIRKRRAASGASSPTAAPVHPTERLTVVPKEIPKTEAEILLEAMLNAGTPSETFLRGVDTVKK